MSTKRLVIVLFQFYFSSYSWQIISKKNHFAKSSSRDEREDNPTNKNQIQDKKPLTTSLRCYNFVTIITASTYKTEEKRLVFCILTHKLVAGKGVRSTRPHTKRPIVISLPETPFKRFRENHMNWKRARGLLVVNTFKNQTFDTISIPFSNTKPMDTVFYW